MSVIETKTQESTSSGASVASILSTRNLCVQYGQVQALINANIAVRPGQIVSVIGPNGAGKSSLLNALMGNLPGSARVRGEIRYEGDDVSDLPVERRVVRGLALVPESRELFSSMTIEDNLILGGYLYRRFGAHDRNERMEAIYTTFPRLKERRKQLAGTLSGGERQMLVIGRALMSRPKVLMLDEPSLGLAPLIMTEVFRVISRLRETGVATLLIEQNSRAALQVSDYAYVLELGETTLEGPAPELQRDPKVIEAYLGRGH